MINKPEKILKRISKAVGQRQAVLTIGNWDQFLVALIKENENSITQISRTQELNNLENNSFTRVIADYNSLVPSFFNEARRLLLPTGTVIISANCELNIFEKLISKLKVSSWVHEHPDSDSSIRIKPKILQDKIHDNNFLIDGYYGYPGGHLLMMAQIQNKEVTTLFASDKQETVKNKIEY